MTFKDLQKLVQSLTGPEQPQLLQRLRDKPFWIWDNQRRYLPLPYIRNKVSSPTWQSLESIREIQPS
jgi:hypothetical protein